MTLDERAPRARAAETVDAFHRGRFHLVQPAGRGHRAGIDAMLLAGAVPGRFAGRLADLGAGAGAAGLAVVSRCADAQALLVERDEAMADCARRTLDLPANALFAGRAEVLVADVSLAGNARRSAGLLDGSADFVIMNPPFNDASDRVSPDPLRATAHVMEDDLFERWVRTAAAMVRPGGEVAIIARPASLGAILSSLTGRFGSARAIFAHPRADAAAIRVVMRARQGARGRFGVEPPLVLHRDGDDGFSERTDAVINGTASLFDD